MSDTPETDGLEAHKDDAGWRLVVPSKFARRLERERDAAREELARVRKELVSANRGAETNAKVNQGLCSKLAEAERERDEAIKAREAVWHSWNKALEERDEARMERDEVMRPTEHQWLLKVACRLVSEMTNEEIKGNLCYHDRDNQKNSNIDDYDEEDRPQPRNGCYCDNCFSGRDKLAVQMLETQRERDEARKEWDGAIKDRNTAWEALSRVRKELAASNLWAERNTKVNQLLCSRLAEAERERDEARMKTNMKYDNE